MSHQVETMAYANQVPWHGLGVNVTDDITVDGMLVAAGLDWEVQPWPVFAQNPNDPSQTKRVARYAMVRDKDHKVMTVSGERWNPVQNRDILGFMRDYVEAGGAKLETAGALRDGTVIWGLAKINRDFEVTRGDRVNGYLLITGSHVVGTSTTIRTTSVRVVCANTMALAERQGATIYRQNHLSVFDDKLAKKHVAEAVEEFGALEARAKLLKALNLSPVDAVNKVFAPIMVADWEPDFPTLKVEDFTSISKPCAQLYNSYMSAPGNDVGTAWGALNGFTHWADHVAGRDAGARMFRSWMGDLSRKKLKVEQELYQLAA